MSGRVLAAIVIIGGPILTGTGMGTGANAHRTHPCASSCTTVRVQTGTGYAALDENNVRIAVHAGAPDAEPAPTTKGEWLSLYLLLSLGADGKNPTE